MAKSYTKPLFKMAALTSPLIGFAMAMPLIIAMGLGLEYIVIGLCGATMVMLIAWTLNILLLRLRPRFGKYPWLQIPLASAIMILISIVMFEIVQPEIPEEARRLPLVRYVNAIIVNAIIYTLIYLRLLIDTKTELVEENARLKFSTLETQYKLLKEQINPHFLFNALGTSKSLVRRDPVMAENYIIRLSDFLRASLDEAPDLVALKDELKLVRDYVELQQMRFRDSLQYVNDVQDDAQLRLIPFFSLLTLVENAVKHNAMSVENPLVIRIHQEADWIVVGNNLQVKNTGIVSPKSGLHNLRERCRVLGHGEIEVRADASRFEVRVRLGARAAKG